MVPRFGLLVMIAAVTSIGLLAAHTSLLELMEVTLLGFLAGGMRVRARLRLDHRL